MNREGVPGKSPEEMYIQQKLTASEEEFLRTYAGVVNSQLSQLPQHSIDQGQRQKTEDSNCRTPEQHRTGEDSEIPEDRGGWLSINKFLCPP
ncbi:beta-catenin-interacting protein 1 isoform X2 [Passer montanus]|nr:beta-catenin-interacting protein 1 isoform X2 [Passer montanus]